MDRDQWTSRFDTRTVAYGETPDVGAPNAGDVVTPIHLTSTYELAGLDPDFSLEDADPAAGDFLYGRLNNPTRHALEKRLASLEGGECAFAMSSGTAAIATTLLAALEPGDHVVAFDDLYAGTKRSLEALFRDRLNVAVDFVDATDVQNVADAMQPETAVVWMESPTNPLLRLCDIEAIAAVAHEHDALLGVDNTFVSPYFQSPLALGADVVAHSTTKYLNGHSDSIGGAIVTNDTDLADDIAFLQQVGLGDMMAPFDAYLTLRGTKTLSVRMRQHEENATAVAGYLEAHDMVSAVHYPGLESHPQHDLATRQMSGYGGILSFELEGDMDDAAVFLEALEHFTLAVSVGGVESLAELPAGMTHEPLPKAEREAVGITDSLIRLSVGIEDQADLVGDLERGFEAVTAARTADTAAVPHSQD